MGGYSQDVNHRRHPNVPCATAEETAEEPTNKRDHENSPERNFPYARSRQGDHRPNFHSLNHLGNRPERGVILFQVRGFRRWMFSRRGLFAQPECFLALPEHKDGNPKINNNGDKTDHRVHVARALQCWISCAPASAPPMVPNAMISPN